MERETILDRGHLLVTHRFGFDIVHIDEILLDMSTDMCPHEKDRRLIVGHRQTDQWSTTLNLSFDLKGLRRRRVSDVRQSTYDCTLLSTAVLYCVPVILIVLRPLISSVLHELANLKV